MKNQSQERNVTMAQSTAASQEQSVPSASLLARHPLVSYFVLAYALAWFLWLPLVLSKGGGIGLIPFTTPVGLGINVTILIICLGGLGPALAAMIMSACVGGWAEVKRLLKRMVQVRAGIQWYLVALFIPFGTILMAALLLGGSAVFLREFSLPGAVGLLVYIITTFIDMVLGTPIGEEPGWRGFALPRLQQRYGALRGSLILGPLWALWHLPLFLTVWGTFYHRIGVLLGLFLFILLVMSYTFVMTWLFNNTRGSLFLAILFHSAIDTITIESGTTANLRGFLLVAITWAVIAALVISLTKGRLSYKRAVSTEAQSPVEQDQQMEHARSLT
jgi:membrane protease YdiL (CAAX protease family)